MTVCSALSCEECVRDRPCYWLTSWEDEKKSLCASKLIPGNWDDWILPDGPCPHKILEVDSGYSIVWPILFGLTLVIILALVLWVVRDLIPGMWNSVRRALRLRRREFDIPLVNRTPSPSPPPTQPATPTSGQSTPELPPHRNPTPPPPNRTPPPPPNRTPPPPPNRTPPPPRILTPRPYQPHTPPPPPNHTPPRNPTPPPNRTSPTNPTSEPAELPQTNSPGILQVSPPTLHPSSPHSSSSDDLFGDAVDAVAALNESVQPRKSGRSRNPPKKFSPSNNKK